MAELGQNPAPPTLTSLGTPTPPFPKSYNLVSLDSVHAKATFGKNRTESGAPGSQDTPPSTHISQASFQQAHLCSSKVSSQKAQPDADEGSI